MEYTHILLDRQITASPSWTDEVYQETIESKLVVEMPGPITSARPLEPQEQELILDWLVEDFPGWKPVAYARGIEP